MKWSRKQLSPLELVQAFAKSTLHFERDFSRSGRLRPSWCSRDFCSAVGSVIRRSRISRPSVVGSTWTVHRPHRFYQRPIGVVLTILYAVVRSQEHLALIMSSHSFLFKMVGLHYIDFSKPAIADTRLASLPTSKIAEFSGCVTNLG